MKVLICGLGSIGLRHLKNLQKLSIKKKNIKIFKTNRGLKKNNTKGIKIFYDLKEALLEKPRMAIICNPTHMHIPTAIKCAENKLHIFIEKPLSHNKSGLKKILQIQKKNKIKIMIGYMMRFHPIILKIKSLLKKKYIGRIYHFKMHWGEYLPNWHKNEDYKKGYAANKSMGGGVALTLSHDLDLSYFLFGKIVKCYCKKNKLNFLKIKSESSVDFMLSHTNNITGNIHLDYIQKKPERFIQIYGEKGKLEMNYYKKSLNIVKKNINKNIKFKNFQRNDLFLDEMKYFLNCVKRNIKPAPNLHDSIYVLKKTKLI